MPDDQEKYFVFIGGRNYHPDGPHFSPKLGQPYIVITLQSYRGGWEASGGVRFDVPNSEIRPDVLSSSATVLETDLRGFLGNRVWEKDIRLMIIAICSLLSNLVIDAAKKTHEKEAALAT